MRRRKVKQVYTPLTQDDARFWGNNVDPTKKKGIKAHVTSFKADMEANDKLPKRLRNAVNSTPNIKWSSVKTLEALIAGREKFPFLTESELIDQLIIALKLKDKKAGEKLDAEAFVEPNKMVP